MEGCRIERHLKCPESKRASPHFSPAFYCGGTDERVYCVALPRAPRRTVKYACGALSRAPCIHAPLHPLATKPDEKCGLMTIAAGTKVIGVVAVRIAPIDICLFHGITRIRRYGMRLVAVGAISDICLSRIIVRNIPVWCGLFFTGRHVVGR